MKHFTWKRWLAVSALAACPAAAKTPAAPDGVEWTRKVLTAVTGNFTGGVQMEQILRELPLDFVEWQSGVYFNAGDALKSRGIRVSGGAWEREFQEYVTWYDPDWRLRMKQFADNGIAVRRDGTVLDSDGRPEYLGSFCHSAPKWRIFQNQGLLRPLAYGADSISQDNLNVLGFLYDRGSFCRWCLGNFNEWLEVNGLPPVPSGFNFKEYLERLPVSSGPGVLEDELVRAYIMYQNASQLDYFRQAVAQIKEECRRLQRPAAPVYGNQNSMARTPYSMIQSGWVDVVWTEDALSRPFPGNGRDANCSFRYKLGIASGDYEKPFWMCLYGHDRDEKRLLWSEALANGGVVVYSGTEPEYAEFARWIDGERHLFQQRERVARVALIDPLVSRIWDWYPELGLTGRTTAPQLQALARMLEEAHIPYEVICLYPPQLRADTVGLEKLKEFPVLLMPEAECLSDGQIQALREAVSGGATLVTAGAVGNMDENRRPREAALTAGLSLAAETAAVLAAEKSDDPARLAAIAAAKAKLEQLPGAALLATDAPDTLWVNLYAHRGNRRLAVHLLNYHYIEGIVTPARNVSCRVTLPAGVKVEICRLSSPGGADIDIPVRVSAGVAEFTVPEIYTYAIASLGSAGEMAAAAELERAEMAYYRLSTAGIATEEDAGKIAGLREADDAAICAAAPALAEHWGRIAAEHLDRVAAAKIATHDAVAAQGATAALALNFGDSALPGWQSVTADMKYDAGRGYGWVAGVPELRRGDWGDAPALYREYLTQEHPARLRVDLAPGRYRATLLTGENNAKIHFDALMDIKVDDRLAVVGIPRRGGVFRTDSFVLESDGDGTVIEFAARPGWESATYKRSWSADAIWFEKIETAATAEADFFLRDWSVTPPYDDSDWTALVREPDWGAPETAWLAYRADDPVAAVDPAALTGGVDEAVYGIRCVIESPVAQTAQLTFSAQARALVRLNDEVVVRDFKASGLEAAENQMTVELRAGRNELSGTVTTDWIGAAFLARLEGASQPVRTLPGAGTPATAWDEPGVFPAAIGLVQGAPSTVTLRTVNRQKQPAAGRFALTVDPEMAELVRITPAEISVAEVAPGAAAEGVFTVELLRPLDLEWSTATWKMAAPKLAAFTAAWSADGREHTRRFRMSGITPDLSWQWRDPSAGRGEISVGNPLTTAKRYRLEVGRVPGWKLTPDADTVSIPAGGTAAIGVTVVADGEANPGEALLPIRLIPEEGAPLTLEVPLVTRGVVGAWNFDEAGAEILDASENAHHGVLGAGMHRIEGVKGGKALAFDDAMSAVAIPWPVRVTDAVTVAAWVRLDRLVPNNIIVAKTGRYGEGEFLLYVNEDSRLVGRILNGLDETSVIGRQLELGKWYHVAMTWTPERLYLYCDGEPVGTNKGYARVIGVSDTPLLLGGGAYAGGVIGAIDDVIIRNDAATPDEVRKMMNP